MLIYNADEEVMYSYVDGAKDGFKFINVDLDSAEDSGLTMDMISKFSALNEDISDDVIARVEKLGDEEVVYIETIQPDEEMGDMLLKMWYSVKYNTPLKYEIYMGQEALVSVNITEIEKDIKLDKDTFNAPADVVFQEVDISDMME